MLITLSTHQGAGWQLGEDAALHAIDDPLHLVCRCASAKGVLWVDSIKHAVISTTLHPAISNARVELLVETPHDVCRFSFSHAQRRRRCRPSAAP
jgi:hypothetical protein